MTLLIHRLAENGPPAFKLTGRIQGVDVPELLALFEPDLPWTGIVLDLEQVKLVDRDAVRFLALCEATGAELRNCSAYIREWIMQEKRSTNRNKTEAPTGFAG
jgi:hypothetical protein